MYRLITIYRNPGTSTALYTNKNRIDLGPTKHSNHVSGSSAGMNNSGAPPGTLVKSWSLVLASSSEV